MLFISLGDPTFKSSSILAKIDVNAPVLITKIDNFKFNFLSRSQLESFSLDKFYSNDQAVRLFW